MYALRLFATKHSKSFETLYNWVKPRITPLLYWASKRSGGKLDSTITWIEKQAKGLMFDCKMCGNCVLSSTGMTCPMNCPKTIRNGPCGGVRANGHCEVKPAMKCVWVQAWDGASRMRNADKIHVVQFAVNRSHQGSSSWLRMAEEERIAHE